MQNAVFDNDELAAIQPVDRLLPSQPYLSKMYTGDKFYVELIGLLCSVLSDHGEIKYDVRLKEGVSYAALGSSINTLHFYQFLIGLGRYKKILELGTYVGVSAMYLADAARKNDGNVTTIELGREFFDLAKDNIARNGLAPYVWSVQDDCVRFLRVYHENYDFIIIDAAKESYPELLRLAMTKLLPGGLILVDDVFFQGDTLNQHPTTEKGMGVRMMLNMVPTIEGYEKIILPIGNGLLLMRKL